MFQCVPRKTIKKILSGSTFSGTGQRENRPLLNIREGVMLDVPKHMGKQYKNKGGKISFQTNRYLYGGVTSETFYFIYFIY
jgi:hypothetical protein